MSWNIEYTDEFERWWEELDGDTQVSVEAVVTVLQEPGPRLNFPYSSDIKQSRHGNMRELRIQHKGIPYKVLYAFDPRRTVILLIGASKVGDKRWYKENVPKADILYNEYLAELKREELV